MAKTVLGRGLNALLAGADNAGKATFPGLQPAADEGAREEVRRVAVKNVSPCPWQPRKDFSQESLQELADSIKEQGIVQPLIVRRRGENFELIAGERRWRAAQIAGLTEVPVIVREADDRAMLELALIENLQRENLNAIEEAQGFAQLIGQFHLTQEEAAAKVGRSRVSVANALRLLKLAPDLQSFVREGRLSVGHAKVILGLEAPQDQRIAADRVLKKSLNVRQTEALVASMLEAAAAKGPQSKPGFSPQNAHTAAMQSKIQERFGTKVLLHYKEGKGTIEIRFFNDDDLERILKVAGVQID